MTVHEVFGDDFDPHAVFATEQAIRLKHVLFRSYCYKILQERNLPLAHIALTAYLSMIEHGKNELRKDQMSHRELHEESHVDVIDKLLLVTGEGWIREEHGSLDALFTAIICHDIIEDFGVSPAILRSILQSGMESLRRNGSHLSGISIKKTQKDLDDAMKIVVLLSRKNEHGILIVGEDRILQAERWLEHPYAMPIKLIDWANKLQTMPGVDHFEDNGFEKMVKVLDETALLFLDEQQNLVKRAIKKYPQIKEPCLIMEQFPSMLFQMLRTYKTLREEKVIFDPQNAQPFNFKKPLKDLKPLLKIMLPGNNYIEPFIERLSMVATTDEKVDGLITHMIKPAFTGQKPRRIPALHSNLGLQSN